MYIVFNKENKIKLLLFLVLLFEYRFFQITNIPFVDSVKAYYIVRCLGIIGTIVFFSETQALCREYRFFSWLLSYTFISQTILTIYSMITYEQTFTRVFAFSGLYLTLLIFFILIICFDQFGMDKSLKYLFILEGIRDIVAVLHAVVFNFTGIRLFALNQLASKTNNIRLDFGLLFPLLIIYLFSMVLTRYNFRILLLLIVSLCMELYIQNVRVMELSFIACFIIMWIVAEKKIQKRLVKNIIICLVVILLGYMGVITDIINGFSIDPEINKNYTSSLARVEAIEYYLMYLRENPIFGMGWINRTTPYLATIASGPKGTYHFDDLGIMGQLFRQGIVGSITYLLYVGRMLYISIKLPDNCKNKVFVVGVCTYIFATLVSLNVFDVQRVLAATFYVAIVEYIWHKYQART